MRPTKKADEVHHTPHTSGEKKSKKYSLYIWVCVILLACIIGNYILFRVALLQHEYGKVGGKQNYDILSTLQMQQIESILQYYKTNPEAIKTQISNEAKVATTSQLDGTSLGAMQEGYAKLGDPNSPLILVEYSDLECPYCKQQNELKVYESLAQKFPGKLSYMFKHFPLNIHPGSEKKHEALECSKKLAGDDAYFQLKDQIFSENTYQSPVDFNAVKTAAVGLGINEQEFNDCINSNEFNKKIQDSINEGKNSFGVNGTPATVIINRETGEFKFFSGVQQASALESTIQELLGE